MKAPSGDRVDGGEICDRKTGPVGILDEWSVVGEDRCVALCDQDVCGAGVGCEGDGWPIDSEDAMIGQWSGIGIGM